MRGEGWWQGEVGRGGANVTDVHPPPSTDIYDGV